MEKRWLLTQIAISGLFVLLISALSFQRAGAAPATSSHPEVKLMIISATSGQPQFIISQALVELINKDHPWLRASNRASLGWIDNVKTLARNPNMRKDTMIISDQAVSFLANKGEGPFKGFQYNTGKILAVMQHVGILITTLDPKIKTWRELKGKRVNGAQTESMLWYYFKTMADLGWDPEIVKTMKIEHMIAGPAKDALLDRLINATIQGMSSAGPAWVPSPHLKEITTAHPAYGVDWGAEAMDTTNKKVGYPLLPPMVIPPAAYGLANKEPHNALRATTMWVVDETMPDEVAYEIAKKIYENIDKFGEYHVIGKMMKAETLTDFTLGEQSWHRGAVKFYKEKGLKVGR
jgi:TRAP transporter TAXI family solute receptor